MPIRVSLRLLVPLAAAAALAACSGSSTSGLVPSQTAFNPASIAPLATAPSCKGQKTTSKYATVTATLSSSGGVFCVPSFGGFGGSIEYPSVDPSVSVTLTTSTTNYNGKLKGLGSGKPLLYIQIALTEGTTFGTHQPAGGGIVGKLLKSGSTYTAYGAVVGFPVSLGSCTAKATSSKYGGEIGGIGNLLKGHSVPLPVTGVVEIYAGSSGKGAC
jgi:hypothetical protein